MIYVPFNFCLKRKGGEEMRFAGSFRNRNWDVNPVNNVIKRFENTGGIYRKEGIGLPITVDVTENQMKVKTLASLEEGRPGTHNSV